MSVVELGKIFKLQFEYDTFEENACIRNGPTLGHPVKNLFSVLRWIKILTKHCLIHTMSTIGWVIEHNVDYSKLGMQ